jgi:hypothetical protein
MISNISPESEWYESECQTIAIAGCSFAIFHNYAALNLR